MRGLRAGFRSLLAASFISGGAEARGLAEGVAGVRSIAHRVMHSSGDSTPPQLRRRRRRSSELPTPGLVGKLCVQLERSEHTTPRAASEPRVSEDGRRAEGFVSEMRRRLEHDALAKKQSATSPSPSRPHQRSRSFGMPPASHGASCGASRDVSRSASRDKPRDVSRNWRSRDVSPCPTFGARSLSGSRSTGTISRAESCGSEASIPAPAQWSPDRIGNLSADGASPSRGACIDVQVPESFGGSKIHLSESFGAPGQLDTSAARSEAVHYVPPLATFHAEDGPYGTPHNMLCPETLASLKFRGDRLASSPGAGPFRSIDDDPIISTSPEEGPTIADALAAAAAATSIAMALDAASDASNLDTTALALAPNGRAFTAGGRSSQETATDNEGEVQSPLPLPRWISNAAVGPDSNCGPQLDPHALPGSPGAGHGSFSSPLRSPQRRSVSGSPWSSPCRPTTCGSPQRCRLFMPDDLGTALMRADGEQQPAKRPSLAGSPCRLHEGEHSPKKRPSLGGSPSKPTPSRAGEEYPARDRPIEQRLSALQLMVVTLVAATTGAFIGNVALPANAEALPVAQKSHLAMSDGQLE